MSCVMFRPSVKAWRGQFFEAGKMMRSFRPMAVEADENVPSPPKPFPEAVKETFKGIKEWFDKPESLPKTDPQVREQVSADLDRLIKRDKL
jgi:hypothetical protein